MIRDTLPTDAPVAAPVSETKIVAGSLLVFAILLLLSHRNSSIVTLGLDPCDYIEVSRIPLASKTFWTIRPFTVPLFFKIMAQNAVAIVLAQTALHLAGWGLLAWAVKSSLRSRALAWIGFASFLSFSLVVEINLWNFVILSESVSHSLGAATLAVAILYFKALEGFAAVPEKPGWLLRWGWPIALLSTAALWSFCRDNTPYTLLFLGPAFFLLFLFRGTQSRFPLPAALLLGLGAPLVGTLQLALWAHSARVPWTYTVTTNICQRVLPDPDARRFFREAGMPDSHILDTFSGRFNAYGQNATSPNPDPTLIDSRFDDWVLHKGSKTYMLFVLSHPLQTMGWAWKAREALACPSVRQYGISPPVLAYRVAGGRKVPVPELGSRPWVNGETAWTDAIGVFLFGNWRHIWLLALLASVAPLLFWPRSRSFLLFLPLVLYLTAILQGALVVVADCVEIDRHGLWVAISLRLCLWLALFLVLDETRGRTHGRRLGAG